MSNSTTISKYLISKIKENNVKHVFGIPGDYIINFYKDLAEEKDIKTVVTCDEQGAGFAADAYARLNGLGVAVFTYCAGALKAVNTTAQAFADRSPVVVIAGAPTRKSVKNNELVHHRVKDFNTELKVFEQVTVASAYLREDNAFQEIDRVFETVKALSGPGYIEVPYDLVDYPLPIPTSTKFQYPYRAMENIDAEKMHEAMAEVTTLLQHATNPVVIVGLEVHRLGIQKEVQRFIERLDLPFVTMIQSKGVISEDHPNYLGVYEGAMCRTELREFVERADCLIMLGIFKTDMDLGYFSAKLDPKRTIHARKDCLCVSYHNYQDIGIKMVLHEMDRRNIVLGKGIERDSWPKPIDFKSSPPSKGKKLTTGKFFEFINATLNSKTVTIADIGASLFGGGEMRLPKDAMFVGSPYYACMGFAVPGGLGTACAKPDMRTVVIVGDGAFQMTGTEVSTMIRHKLNPIVIILNNDGYTTERIIEEGPFDDIQPWNYAKITELFGGGKSFVAKTEDEFMDALKHSYANKDTVSVIEAKVDRLDLPAAQVRELDYNKGRR